MTSGRQDSKCRSAAPSSTLEDQAPQDPKPPPSPAGQGRAGWTRWVRVRLLVMLLCVVVMCCNLYLASHTRHEAPLARDRASDLSSRTMKSIAEWAELARKKARRIPPQLVYTAKEDSLEQMPRGVQGNVRRALALSPGVRVRWLGDAACRKYIKDHFDSDLLDIFNREGRGSFRGDICRACVLAREGGFYLDLDVELRVPLLSLADENTTFVSSYTEDNAILNALLAAVPGSPVMKETLAQIRSWYKEGVHADVETFSRWMGPVTMLRAIRNVMKKDCPNESREKHRDRDLQWTCGPHVLRLYQEKTLDCSLRGSPECPPRRADSYFAGVRFGIFNPGPERELVAWPRFAECQDWGCKTGGWDERADAASVAAARRGPEEEEAGEEEEEADSEEKKDEEEEEGGEEEEEEGEPGG